MSDWGTNLRIAATIITMDRTPGENYLGNTLHSLEQSGFFEHPSFSLEIHHSGGADANLSDQRTEHATVFIESEPLHFNDAFAKALKSASSSVPDYVLFMEDDIKVCEDFPEFVVSALSLHGVESVLDFVTYYQEVADQYFKGERVMKMDTAQFYGTQCFAMTRQDALSYADFVARHRDTKAGFADVWFDDWLKESGRPRSYHCTIPSAAQHTGKHSNQNHSYFTAPGFKGDVEARIPVVTSEYEILDNEGTYLTLRNRRNNASLYLNDTAHLIYLSCDGRRSISQIVKEISEISEVDKYQLDADIRTCLASLELNRVINYKD